MLIGSQTLLLDTKNLKPHPINLQLYGEQDTDYKLVESIKEKGQLQPLVIIKDNNVLGDYIIISGHRRWKALKYLEKEANCRLVSFEDDEAELEIKQAIIESNKYRKKNNIQIINEVNLLRSGYAETEKKCREATLKQSTHVQNSVQEKEAGSENGRHGDQVTDELESVAVLFYQVFSQFYRNKLH